MELAAVAGMDFVRLDFYHVPYSYESLENRVLAAYSYGITPWVRVPNDPFVIATTLDLGVQALTLPGVHDVASARAAVDAVYYPPKGRRDMSRPLRSRGMSGAQYVAWEAENVLLSCQIEDAEGLAECERIVAVEGVDIIQTGRNDLALSLGVVGEPNHPKVQEAEKRIVHAALDAGKQVSLMVRMTDEDLDTAGEWVAKGVRILTLDSDYQVLIRAYSAAVKRARALGAPGIPPG